MATYRSFSVTASGSFGSTKIIPVTKPTGLAVGDVMLAIIWVSAQNASITNPTGWTLDITNSSIGDSVLKVFHKIATSDDVAASGFDFAVDTTNIYNNLYGGGVIYRIDNTGLNVIIDDYSVAGQIEGFNTTLTVEDPITTTRTGALLIGIIFAPADDQAVNMNGFSVTNNNPSWTEDVDTRYHVGGSNEAAMTAIYRAEYNYAQSTGNWTMSPSAINGFSVTGVLLAVSGILNSSTTLDVVSATSSAQDFASITGGTTTTLGVVSATATALDMTGAKADWSYTTKPETTWDYTDK